MVRCQTDAEGYEQSDIQCLQAYENNGHISISVRKRNQEIIIEVTDTGSGIAARDIDRIFDRFFQAEQLDSLSNASTGIGLALTKGIIELHHGSIEVSSEQGEGSTFRIHLKQATNTSIPNK